LCGCEFPWVVLILAKAGHTTTTNRSSFHVGSETAVGLISWGQQHTQTITAETQEAKGNFELKKIACAFILMTWKYFFPPVSSKRKCEHQRGKRKITWSFTFVFPPKTGRPTLLLPPFFFVLWLFLEGIVV
jgi:hypothetical protein